MRHSETLSLTGRTELSRSFSFSRDRIDADQPQVQVPDPGQDPGKRRLIDRRAGEHRYSSSSTRSENPSNHCSPWHPRFPRNRISYRCRSKRSLSSCLTERQTTVPASRERSGGVEKTLNRLGLVCRMTGLDGSPAREKQVPPAAAHCIEMGCGHGASSRDLGCPEDTEM